MPWQCRVRVPALITSFHRPFLGTNPKPRVHGIARFPEPPCPRGTGQPHGSWQLSCGITSQASFPSHGVTRELGADPSGDQRG